MAEKSHARVLRNRSGACVKRPTLKGVLAVSVLMSTLIVIFGSLLILEGWKSLLIILIAFVLAFAIVWSVNTIVREFFWR
jgi:uncharacterized membrane protein